MPALLFESHFRTIPVPFRQFMGDALNCDLVVYWLYNARRGEAPPSIADQLAAISQPSSSELYDAIIRVLRRARTTTCAPRVACRVRAGASNVRFEDPVADAREMFTFLMVVTEVVGQRTDSEPQRIVFEMTIERRAGVCMLMRAAVVTAP